MKSKFKKLCISLLTLLAATSVFCLSACADGGGSGGNDNISDSVNDDKNGELNQEVNNMYLKVGDATLTATLVDNPATQALKERLKTAPITINMNDYGGWEKVGGFGFDLPTSNEQITAQPCEFVLYQGNQLVIFYGSNSWSYTRLGKIEGVTQAELKEILGNGDITVTLSLEK